MQKLLIQEDIQCAQNIMNLDPLSEWVSGIRQD